jgi:protein-S-isoprenylcysteine O-methyltransferase Ste14
VDTVRYVSAVLILIAVPFGLSFWLLIHPLARFWRRRGTAATYTVVAGTGLALSAIAFRFRLRLLATEYGTSYPLAVLGLALIVTALLIARTRRRHLTWRILFGLPELSAGAAPGRLLKEGIYARIRHPRYVEAVLGICGYALVANYLAGYLACAVSLPLLYLIVLLEERELRSRFGAEYEAYCREVPRFLPRFGPRPRHCG